MIDNELILLTLLYVVDRMTDKLADVNNQSSVGMFSFHDVSHYSCCTVCTRLLVYIICVGSLKVIDFGTNGKRVYTFLLVINSNFSPILHCFGDMAA